MSTSRQKLAEAETHRRAGRMGAAERCYREAVAADPASAPAHNQLGIVLAQQKRTAEAIACFQEARRLQPDSDEVSQNLKTVLADQRFAEGLAALAAGQVQQAATCFRHAIELRPGFVEACNNLGAALQHLGKLDESEHWLRQALALREDYADAHNNLGGLLEAQGLLSPTSAEQSLASFRRAAELRPDCANFRLNHGLALLRLGRFAEGWPEFEWRLLRDGTPRRFAQPRLPQGELAGRTVLLWEDQGAGDSLHCVRYAELLKQRGARVVVECREELARLFAACPGVDEVVPHGATPPPFDFELPLLSLPRAFGTTLDTIPAKVPYLFADAALVETWKPQFSGPELKVGISWQGNPNVPTDRFRSIPLEQFAPLAAVPNVRLYSFQMGAGREQLDHWREHLAITDLSDRISSFQDTAAIMRSLDLVIVSDSAPAHLAGALGVPVWMALAHVADWRWLLGRSDSPWYPTMRLYRQDQPGNWPGVFDRIVADLADFRARRGLK